MNTARKITILGLALTIAIAIVAPTFAVADTQSNKNMWRNLAIGSGALAGYGLVKGNGTATTLGLAGAAYSGYRYEQDRKHQSQRRSAWRQDYYRRQHQAYSDSGLKYYWYQGHEYCLNSHNGYRSIVR